MIKCNPSDYNCICRHIDLDVKERVIKIWIFQAIAYLYKTYSRIITPSKLILDLSEKDMLEFKIHL